MNTEKALADNQNWKEKYLETYISPNLDMAIIEGIQLMLEAIDSEIVKPLAAKPTQVEDWKALFKAEWDYYDSKPSANTVIELIESLLIKPKEK